MSLLDADFYYTKDYPEFIDITQLHEKAHWHEGEAKLQQDVEQWKIGVITDKEKEFLKTILRIFTQSDVAVNNAYLDNLIPVIRNNSARDMLTSFAGREGVHKRGYALISDTLGFGDEFYSEFTNYKTMKDKIDFMFDMRNSTPSELAISVAKQALSEGVSLFASFAMLLNMTRYGKMIGQGDVVLWSIRDESLHVRGLTALFNRLVEENPEIVTDAFKKEIYEVSRALISLEDAFIDDAFGSDIHKGITADETKQYIRAVLDYRMEQLGFKTQYDVTNPFPWIDELLSNAGIEQFFEVNTTNYSKDSMIGEYY
jgi:glutaredoxin 3